MNKIRREALKKIFNDLSDQKDKFEELKDEEAEAYENMPENLRDSAKGEEMSEIVDELEELFDELGDICERLEDIICR